MNNLDKINEIKREKIKRGILYLIENDKDKIIDKMSVFGSAIRDDCKYSSDIDLVLYTDVDVSDIRLFYIYGNLPIVMDDLCDIFIESQLKEGKFKDTIKETEVVVYESIKH